METLDPVKISKAKETLRRFVIRARRVETHSLVKNNKILEYVQPKLRLTYSEKQDVKIEYLMPDEEIFESLAARVRPCILNSEPVYLGKVFDAIEICMGSRQMNVEARQCFETCRRRFADLCNKRSGASYSVQIFDGDNNASSDSFTDLQIGEAWLYADLVHSDPHGDKARAAEVPYRDRYYAGTSFFSTLTVIIVNTYRLITDLNKRFEWQIEESAWHIQVSVAEKDFDFTAEDMYIFPVGTIIPEGACPADIPGAINIGRSTTEAGWNLDPWHRAVGLFYDDTDKIIDQFRAIYFQNDDQITVLIADSLICTFSLDNQSLTSDVANCSRPLTLRLYKNKPLVGKILDVAQRARYLKLILKMSQNNKFVCMRISLNRLTVTEC